MLDQTGVELQLTDTPARIVSLVPSQTELLHSLGLDHQIRGITRFCIHPPEWQHSKTIVGGTKNFLVEKIDRLQPDLIIGNKEENYREGIEALRSKYPVYVSDIATLDDAYCMIRDVGTMTNTTSKALELVNAIKTNFDTLTRRSTATVLYLIWRKPWMAAANNTFIHTMLEMLGLENVLAHQSRYPELTDQQIKALNPAMVLLSSEPFPFAEKHIGELQALLPDSKLLLVDGEMFSWYGSRLLLAPAYFNSLHLR